MRCPIVSTWNEQLLGSDSPRRQQHDARQSDKVTDKLYGAALHSWREAPWRVGRGGGAKCCWKIVTASVAVWRIELRSLQSSCQHYFLDARVRGGHLRQEARVVATRGDWCVPDRVPVFGQQSVAAVGHRQWLAGAVVVLPRRVRRRKNGEIGLFFCQICATLPAAWQDNATRTSRRSTFCPI